MIVVVGRVQTDAQRRDALVQAGEAVAAASRQEAGCLGYRLYAATEDPLAFVFIEEWKDDAALQAHFGTEHVAAFMRTIAPLVTAPPDVQFHEVASTRDLSNVTSG